MTPFARLLRAEFRKAVDTRAARWLLEIERDAFLVPVDAQEIRALTFEKRRTPGPCVVAFSRLFDLDDTCAHVRQQHGAVRPGQHAREIEHGDSVEWRHNE